MLREAPIAFHFVNVRFYTEDNYTNRYGWEFPMFISSHLAATSGARYNTIAFSNPSPVTLNCQNLVNFSLISKHFALN